MAFDSIIRFRCETELEARLARLVRQPENRGRDAADLCRIALEDYCTHEERKLHLKPITTAEISEQINLLLMDRDTRAAARPVTGNEVRYKIKRPKK